MDKFQRAFLDSITKDMKLPEEYLRDIRPAGKLSPSDVIRVYRDDYQARLEEALGKNFEASWVLMGDEDFHRLAQDYIASHPSNLRNLTPYGDQFPEFLSENGQEDFIIDMARFEKNFWDIFHLAPRLPKSLAEEDFSAREFDLTTGFFLSHSSIKLHDLWLLREGTDQGLSLDDFEGEEWLVVYRTADKVDVKKLTHGQFQIFTLIRETKNLTTTFEKLEQLQVQTSESDWPLVFQILAYF